jgi:hypothetical protein
MRAEQPDSWTKRFGLAVSAAGPAHAWGETATAPAAPAAPAAAPTMAVVRASIGPFAWLAANMREDQR